MKVSKFLLYLTGLFSTFYFFQIKNIPFSLIFALLFSMVCVLRKCLKFKITSPNYAFLGFVGVAFVSGIMNQFFFGRKLNMVPIYVYVIILLFFYCLQNVKKSETDCFIKGLKLSCKIHIVWCFLQFIAYKAVGMDINSLIFVQKLHLTDAASRIQGGTLIVSGLCAHPSNLVPTLLLSVFLFDKWYVWIACIGIAALSSNSTLIIAMSLAVLFRMYTYFKEHKFKFVVSEKIVVLFCAALPVSVYMFFKVGFYDLLTGKFNELFLRVSERSDASTAAHLSYYTRLPDIFSRFSLIEILFGWGIGRSGTVFSVFYHLYAKFGDWSVESDPMNFVYSLGIIGAFCLYFFLISIAVKSFKFDIKTSAFMVIMLICGFFYAVQYIWVVQLEVFIFAVISKKQGFFSDTSNKNKLLEFLKELKNEK